MKYAIVKKTENLEAVFMKLHQKSQHLYIHSVGKYSTNCISWLQKSGFVP